MFKAMIQKATFGVVLAAVVCAASVALTGCASQSEGVRGEETTAQTTGLIGKYTSGPEGFDTHAYFYDDGREVVVFDAQFTEDLARKLIDEIKAQTDSPIRYVVVTHPNPDKFNGVGPFRELGAEVIASEATAKAIPGVHAYKKYYFVEIAGMFTDATYPPEATIDRTFTGAMTLELAGGGRVELKELSNAGVSSTQTVAWVDELDALFVGDLVHHKAHAWLEGGIVEGAPAPDLSAWRAALGELRAYQGATVYGGRGQEAPIAEAVDGQIAYLDQMETLVQAYIDGLGERKAELSGEGAGEHYKALAQQAAAAFPDYALSYMIEFGVYGLVNSKL